MTGLTQYDRINWLWLDLFVMARLTGYGLRWHSIFPAVLTKAAGEFKTFFFSFFTILISKYYQLGIQNIFHFHFSSTQKKVPSVWRWWTVLKGGRISHHFKQFLVFLWEHLSVHGWITCGLNGFFWALGVPRSHNNQFKNTKLSPKNWQNRSKLDPKPLWLWLTVCEPPNLT